MRFLSDQALEDLGAWIYFSESDFWDLVFFD